MIAASELRRIEKNLLPSLVLARARVQSSAAFARTYEGTLLLLINVDDDQGDLRVGLDESTAEVPPVAPTRDRIGFSTEEVRASPSPSSPPAALDHLELRKRLLTTAYYAVPVKKRDIGFTKAFTGKVSVGRARNNDIVLRHPTVSKFHAWFEVDDPAGLLVADARSKNRTWLAGEPLTPHEPVLVSPGATIRFGRVTTLVVTPEALWGAAVGD